MLPLFLLASASPARRRLLQTAGIDAIVCPSDIDESQIKKSDPSELVQTLAELKAENIALRLKNGEVPVNSPPLPESVASWLIAGFDSVLWLKGEIHGKPADAAEAIERWKMMRGNIGELYTGHALIDLATEKVLVATQVTRVYFAQVSDAEIEAYVSTGEPLKCAGCFALEGKGGLFVEKLEGCHTNVIGLSLPLLREMLAKLGYKVTDFWQ
ncbi:Maf-like protein [Ancylothrix sp. C2]|uniref:nucleoside triphosphate pyrophosphatase n=1 Tax=Ancylothrix sp. D3o TaxID=2953691 RepID=UPI0021BB44E5|nr:nucleoside triphosphate pyrophosphatase [Ancylothrix sp. D3o]MCT7951049.1 Maf-like protein [Ancylothrix sp. D3o]